MIGDYYTNQLLSGAASTSMFGNLIQGQLEHARPRGPGRGLSLLLLLVLLAPDDLLRGRDEPVLEGGGGRAPSVSAETPAEHGHHSPTPSAGCRRTKPGGTRGSSRASPGCT